VLPGCVPADCRITQVVQQQVPHRRASHSDSPPGKCTTPSEVLPAVVDWRIFDLAVIRRWRLVDRHPSGTGELVRADSCTPWCRACTWLSLARQASDFVIHLRSITCNRRTINFPWWWWWVSRLPEVTYRTGLPPCCDNVSKFLLRWQRLVESVM